MITIALFTVAGLLALYLVWRLHIPQSIAARLKRTPSSVTFQANDRLRWWEELPLGLALLAQSYVVGLWYYRSISGAAWWSDLAVALGAGLSLDLIVVTTVMGRRAGRSSGWSWATSFGAFICSSLIALDRYGWEPRSLLHVAFPLVVFLYSQHLAAPAKSALQSLPERSKTTEAPAPANDTAPAFALELSATDSAPHVTTLPTAPTALVLVEPIAYPCPHCGASLKSKQARGAAASNGYCPACKSARKVA